MKNLLLPILAIVSLHATYAQNNSINCTIDINGVKAGINVAGDMHWDLDNASHEVPKGSGKHSVFASAFWIGALDAGGQLHVAAQTYRQTGEDYSPGPIGSISIPIDSASYFHFNRIWKMNRWKIEQFKDQFQNGNVTNGTYTVPDEIATWPAKGNGVVNNDLAPFVDFNGDGLYNSMQGDYPDIKGDQMLFYIFNDSLITHTETGGAKLGVEVQASVYAYHCSGIVDSLSALNYTTLYHYTIINRSPIDYSNVYMGIWSDMDLGNYFDDYVGCDSTRAAGFAYNGDNDDDGAMGYGLNPPMQNVKILRGTLAPPNDGLDNNLNGTIDEPGERTTMNHFQHYQNDWTVMGNPGDENHYYQYLQSRWKDSTHVTYGSNGYNPSGTPSNFMFSGVPYSGIGWSEALVGNTPADRRLISSSGPFSLAAGDTATLDFAFIFTRNSLNPNGLTTSIARNQADLDRVQSWFDQNNFPSCEVYVTGLQETTSEKLSLYPNPATTLLYLKGSGRPVAGIRYTIHDTMGKVVRRGLTAADGSINISTLPPQVYLLQTEVGRARFVKM